VTHGRLWTSRQARSGSGTPGYRDALCSLLAETVIVTYEVTGQGLVIELESGLVRVDPAPEDLVGPEIAMLYGFDDGKMDGVAARRGVIRGSRLTRAGSEE
jgi:hypothetical protein